MNNCLVRNQTIAQFIMVMLAATLKIKWCLNPVFIEQNTAMDIQVNHYSSVILLSPDIGERDKDSAPTCQYRLKMYNCGFIIIS